MRRLVAVAAACALTVGAIVMAPSAIGAPIDLAEWTPQDGDEAFTLGEGWPERTPGWQGVIFESNGLTYLWPSRMAGIDAAGMSKGCASLEDDWCKNHAVRVLFYAQLPHCVSTQQTWCVGGVHAVSTGGSRANGVPTGAYPPAGPADFAGDHRLNVPTGATPTTWELPGITHTGGTSTFLSLVVVEGSLERDSPANPWSPLQLPHSFTAVLYPIKVQEGPYVAPKVLGGWGVGNWNFGPECAQATNGSCARRYAFPDRTRFGISVRLGSAPGSFFHGRLTEPTLAVLDGSGAVVIDVEAQPARVPVVASWQKWADLPDYVRELYPVNFAGPSVDYGDYREWSKDLTKRVMLSQPTAGGTRSMDELSAWLRFLGDKATAVPTMWSFSSVPYEELQGANACYTRAGRVSGIVTTNATSYSAGPPALDKRTQDLNYQVAAPHFTRTGEVFSGTYTLALRSDVARCIYGFTNAPIKASVQVLGADGESRVATTAVSEQKGWLTLTALNFEYSQPTIAVKLKGKKKKR